MTDELGPVITPANILNFFRGYTDIRDTILFIRYLGGPDPNITRERNYLLNDNPTNLKVRVLDIMIYPDRREWNILALVIEGPGFILGGEFSFYYPRDEFRLPALPKPPQIPVTTSVSTPLPSLSITDGELTVRAALRKRKKRRKKSKKRRKKSKKRRRSKKQKK